jgi:hypothetical protein
MTRTVDVNVNIGLGHKYIDLVVETASCAFWQSVADALPAIKTGDLDPPITAALHAAMNNAVIRWVEINS